MTTPAISPLRQWAIVGPKGLYPRVYSKRHLALFYHAYFKGRSWRECRKDGDRCVRVVIVAEPV